MKLPQKQKLRMKKAVKIFLTNWINFTVIFIILYITIFFSSIVENKSTFIDNLFWTAFGIIIYGLPFWAILFISTLFLDTLLFVFIPDKNLKYVKHKLIFESIVISSPFIYWFILYTEWIPLVAVISFFIGQYLRHKRILKILSQK